MQSDNINKCSKKKSFWPIIPIIFALLAPACYLMGRYYHDSYLSALGVSPNDYPRTVDYYMSQAFGVVTSVANETFLAFQAYGFWYFFRTFTVIFSAFVLVIVILRFNRNKTKKTPFLKKHKEKLWFNYLVIPSLGTLVVFFIQYALLITMGFFIVMLGMGSIVAAKHAENTINDFTSCYYGKTNLKHDCTFLFKEGDLIASGLLVATSERFISLYNGNSSLTLERAGLVIERTKQKVKSKND